NKHPRVNVLSPSPGVGGHCIAVDPWFIIEAAGKLSQLIKTSRKINDHMPSFVANKVENILSSVEGSKVVTILGITYKANVDDMRESPILELVDLLKSKNCGIRVVDPHIKEHDYLFKDIYKAVQNSDLLLLGVNHFEFRHLDFKKIYKLMRNKYILDTRNYWSSEDLQEIGFISFLLGKG
ncbi:MAG: UDP-N-acetyl-D-mannosamine dehydrogenase, partial [Halanaerobiales bacterium]|nr:UDP-N-acetyl-D-mannosamine dehydrogenase [Halanaerobiales bacterium]